MGKDFIKKSGTIATFTQHILLTGSFSIKITVDSWYLFPHFSGSKPNLTKSKNTGIGVGVQAVACSICCIDLNNNTLRTLGTHSLTMKHQKRKNL